MQLMKRSAREPLFHFLVLGGLVFFAFTLFSEPESEASEAKQVVITKAQVEQAAAQFRKTWRRAPTRQEIDKLIQSHVREDILVQEAIALSMDARDVVIRRRLAQKMEFLIESTAAAQSPTEELLRTYFDENRAAYAADTQIAFEQVFLGPRPTPAEIGAALAALNQGASAETYGQQTLLPASLDLSGPRVIEGTFGKGFFDTLAEAEVGVWAGPAASGYGVHLVRVAERRLGATPAFEAIRDRVEADWRVAISEELVASVYSEMRKGYTVKLPSDADLESLSQ